MLSNVRQIVVALLTFVAAAAQSHAVLVVEGIYWHMTPEGDATIGARGLEGTKVDLEDDLGYDSAEDVAGFNIIIGETHQLAISYMQIDMSAHNRVDRDIEFGDVLFRIGADVSSSLEATLIRGAYRYSFGSDTVRGGFLIGGQYVDFSAEGSAVGFGSDEEDAQVGLPVIGAHIFADPLVFLRLQGVVTYGYGEWHDVDGQFVDAEFSIRLLSDYNFFAGAGYRYLRIDADDDSIPLDVDLIFQGPIFYAGLEF